jgi:hypothetical protein
MDGIFEKTNNRRAAADLDNEGLSTVLAVIGLFPLMYCLARADRI